MANVAKVANVLSTFGTSKPSASIDDILLSVQSIPASEGSLNCLFDNAATCSLITETAAKSLNLVGEKINLDITTVNGTKTINSAVYHVPVIDKKNNKHIIKALQVDCISEGLVNVDLSSVKHLFSDSVQEEWAYVSSRPTGSVDLLVGLDYLCLHPVDLEKHENLRVVQSQFANSLILVGSHPLLKSANIRLNEDVAAIRHYAHASVNRVSIQPVYDYFESDDMGVVPPKRCGNCRNCKECSFRGRMLSLKDQYESQVIETKINYDQTSQQFRVSYPFIQDPSILPDNKGQVIKIAGREEKRLLKSGLLEAFNKEFEKMINYGALVELSDAELKLWGGPKHYVSLQHVVNEDSATTPLRIVTNSSLSDRKGLSLNSILMKGHDTLSDQWDVLTRWRMYDTALCSDVTKAYYSLKTGELEKHVRRVCWRYGDANRKWSVFGFNTVSFGDRPAASFLEIAMRRTAEMNKCIDPVAAVRITEDRYVDDLSTGGTPVEVARFMGKESEDFQQDGTIPQILSKGSLKLKVMVPSGELNQTKIKLLGNKILGVGWNPSSDKLTISFSVSLVHKEEKSLTVVTKDNFSTFDRNLLTPRNLLRIVNSLYDPLGLVAPVTIKLRIAFRDVFRSTLNLNWDTPIPKGKDQNCWLDLIRMLIDSPEITFNRCVKPSQAVGPCQLICFFDGSDDAFAAAIYIRWTLADDSTHVHYSVLNLV